MTDQIACCCNKSIVMFTVKNLDVATSGGFRGGARWAVAPLPTCNLKEYKTLNVVILKCTKAY